MNYPKIDELEQLTGRVLIHSENLTTNSTLVAFGSTDIDDVVAETGVSSKNIFKVKIGDNPVFYFAPGTLEQESVNLKSPENVNYRFAKDYYGNKSCENAIAEVMFSYFNNFFKKQRNKIDFIQFTRDFYDFYKKQQNLEKMHEDIHNYINFPKN